MQKISVIVPVFNAENYLERCVNSILKQTYQNFELILVNDGSADNSGIICDNFAKKDNRIKVLHKQNGGVSAARNAGLEIASGEWICFVDSDDWIYENYLETMFKPIVEKNVDLVICGIDKIEKDKKIVSYNFTNKTIFAFSNKDFANIFYQLRHNPKNAVYLNSPVNKIFNKTLLTNIRFNTNLKVCEDYDFVIQYLKKINSTAFLSENLYCYEYNATSAVHNANAQIQFLSVIANLKATKEYESFLNMQEFLYNQYFTETISNFIIFLFLQNIKFKLEIKETVKNVQKVLKNKFEYGYTKKLYNSQTNKTEKSNILHKFIIALFKTKQYWLIILFCKIYILFTPTAGEI